MWICHKLVVSNEAAAVQACHVLDVHETSAVSNMPELWEAVCGWAPHPVLSITSGFSNTTTLQRHITTTAVGRCCCRTHENCMHAEQMIIILYIYRFFALCTYLVLFSIVLCRTIVTVYTDNIFLYIVFNIFFFTYGKASNNSYFTDGVFYPSPR